MHDPHSQPIQTSQGPMSVRACGCGGIHLCLGGLSLNLAPETATFLHERLTQVLEAREPAKRATEPPREVSTADAPTGGWVRRLFPERDPL